MSIRRILELVLVMFLLAVTTHAASGDDRLGLTTGGNGAWKFYPAEKPTPGLPRVLLIGDSIVNGYRAAVIRELKGRANVDVWLTPAAENTPGLLEDLRKVLAQGPYAVIHFNIGLHGWPKGRIPQGQYEPLMRRYVATMRKHAGHAKLIWASSTPITVDPVNNPTIARRNGLAAKIMKENGILVDDLYSLVSDKLKLGRGDKFHWQPAANELMGRQVATNITQHLPSTKATNSKSDSRREVVCFVGGLKLILKRPVHYCRRGARAA